MGGQRVEEFDLGATAAGCARTATGAPAGRLVTPAGVASGFGVPDVGWVGVDSVEQRAPQRRLPLKVRSDITGDIAFPVDEQLRPLAGIGGEEPGQPARDGITPALPQLAFFAGLEVAEVGGQRLAPALVAAGIDDLEQRPHHRVGRPRIVVRRCRVISAIRECGLRNAMPAQTPSWPSPRPRMWLSRWLSQRSTPLAGTMTSSSAKGSGRGVASSAPRPSARRSVRSARWRCKPIEAHHRRSIPHRL